MFGWLKKKFAAKLILLTGLILIMPAVTYLLGILMASSSIKQYYIHTIDEYGQSEKEFEEFALKQGMKRQIKRTSIDLARQLDLFIAAHKNLSAEKLASMPEFRDIAIQPTGKEGYTLVVDVTTQKILVHPGKEVEGASLASLKKNPGLAPIIENISAAKFGEGEYMWPAGEDQMVLKYLFATPVPQLTRDSHKLVVAATANIEEIMAPTRLRSQHEAVKRILNNIENRRTHDLITYSLLVSGIMGATLIILSLLLLHKGVISLRELASAAGQVATGKFDISVKKHSEDEFGDVTTAFNQMAEVLSETVISRNFYEKAKLDAEKANRLKSEFLTSISHEIRTPLNGILGFADLLLDAEKSEEKKRYLKHIRECGRNLLALINDILDLSKIDAGKVALRTSPVNIYNLVMSVTAPFELPCKQKELKLSVEIDKATPETIKTDEMRLRQILINLVDNAIKFTESGGIFIRVEPYAGHRSGSVLFSVKDTGIGIPKEKHELIFESFTQVEPYSALAKEGTGLGLAISSNLTNLLGGEMWLVSSPGEGSTFCFTIGNTA